MRRDTGRFRPGASTRARGRRPVAVAPTPRHFGQILPREHDVSPPPNTRGRKQLAPSAVEFNQLLQALASDGITASSPSAGQGTEFEDCPLRGAGSADAKLPATLMLRASACRQHPDIPRLLRLAGILQLVRRSPAEPPNGERCPCQRISFGQPRNHYCDFIFDLKDLRV